MSKIPVDYESINWANIEKRFREGTLRSKLMRLAATLTIISIALIVINLIGLFWLRANVQHLIEHRAPFAEATRQAQLGVQRSLATLRGWVALGDPRFKSDRRQIWDAEIMPAVERIDALSRLEDARGSIVESVDLVKHLDELRESVDADAGVSL